MWSQKVGAHARIMVAAAVCVLVSATVLAGLATAYNQPWTRTYVPARGPAGDTDKNELMTYACSTSYGNATTGGVVESPGTGRRFGLLGDSISSQTQLAVRSTSLYPGDSQLHWIGGARCGDTFTGQRAEQLAGVLARNPDVLVIALGSNAESNNGLWGPVNPVWSQTQGPAQALLDDTAGHPCRVLVNLAVTGHGFDALGAPAVADQWRSYSQSENAFLAQYAATHPHTFVYDFNAAVVAHPDYLFDELHLSHNGINGRTNGMIETAQQCFVPDAVEGAAAAGGQNGSVTVWWNPMPAAFKVTQYDVESDLGVQTSVTIPPGGATQPPSVVNVAATNDQNHTYRVRARNASGVSAWSTWTAPVAASGVGSRFHPLAPKRIVDTRDGTGIGRFTALGPQETIRFNLTTLPDRGGLPATPSAISAVAVNVTAVNATQQTFLTLWPGDRSQPPTSSLNPGPTRPQHPAFVTTAVGADGTLAVYNNSGTVHVVIDVAGYYGKDATGSRYQPVAPARILNSTTGLGMLNNTPAKVNAQTNYTVTVAGRGGIPATGASAVVLNVTSLNSSATSFLTLWPSGTRPLSSQLNPDVNLTKPNLAIVPLAADGTIQLFNNSGQTDVLIDVQGWFGAAGGSSGSLFYPITPDRRLDTRPSLVSTTTVAPTGGIYPAAGAIKALDLNVTAIGGPSAGHVTVSPNGGQLDTSNLNFVANEVTSNHVIGTTATSTSSTTLTVNTSAYLIADITGWFG